MLSRKCIRSFLFLMIFCSVSSFAAEPENVCFVAPGKEKVISFGAEIKDAASSTHFYINGFCNYKNKKCQSVIRTELNEKLSMSNPAAKDFRVIKVDESKFVYTLKGWAGEEIVIDAGNSKINFKYSAKAINYSIDQTVSCK